MVPKISLFHDQNYDGCFDLYLSEAAQYRTSNQLLNSLVANFDAKFLKDKITSLSYYSAGGAELVIAKFSQNLHFQIRYY